MAEKINTSEQKAFQNPFPKKEVREVFFVKTENPNQNSHWHDYYEIDFIISGEVTQVINGAEIKSKKGDVFLMMPDNSHQIKTTEKALVYSLLFSGEILHDKLSDQMSTGEMDGCFKSELVETDVAFLKAVFDRIESENQGKRANHSEITGALVNSVVALLLRNSAPQAEADKKHMVIRRAMAFVKKNYASNPSLSDVANFVHMESSYFSVFFKEKAGISFKRYLNEIKLESAAKKLKTTALSVIDVCYSSGFESLSNFHRKFKEKYGATPKEYRDDIK